MKEARDIIAEALPLGPDEWINDRTTFAEVIIKALEKADYRIVRFVRKERQPFVIEDTDITADQ